jgi:hypothetical protein
MPFAFLLSNLASIKIILSKKQSDNKEDVNIVSKDYYRLNEGSYCPHSISFFHFENVDRKENP